MRHYACEDRCYLCRRASRAVLFVFLTIHHLPSMPLLIVSRHILSKVARRVASFVCICRAIHIVHPPVVSHRHHLDSAWASDMGRHRAVNLVMDRRGAVGLDRYGSLRVLTLQKVRRLKLEPVQRHTPIVAVMIVECDARLTPAAHRAADSRRDSAECKVGHAACILRIQSLHQDIAMRAVPMLRLYPDDRSDHRRV